MAAGGLGLEGVWVRAWGFPSGPWREPFFPSAPKSWLLLCGVDSGDLQPGLQPN